MASGYTSRRAAKREEAHLPVRVKCLESESGGWEQSTEALDLSPFGARIRIAYPTEPGRLLHLTLAMPRHIRCFDHEEEDYRIWSLVRYIKTLAAEEDQLPPFEIGVAFTGKECHASHTTDPAQRYDLTSPVAEGGLWGLREKPTDTSPLASGPDRRSEARHQIADDVMIEIYDAEGRVYAREAAKTENISRHGMAAITNLNIVRGRYIRVKSAHYEIAVIAAVRRLGQVGDGRKRLHLEFVDQQWPPL
jgi:hypothetical protein